MIDAGQLWVIATLAYFVFLLWPRTEQTSIVDNGAYVHTGEVAL
ncbi:hypothetical protein [Rhodococcoides fascians]|nr:hypothetical protein [Rhodococcus fascians]